MLIFMLVLWSVGLIGAVLLVIGGWRGGQVNQHLLCRRCRFDLSGHNQVPLICPECGRDLVARRATIRGERSPLRLVIAIGLLTLVVTGFGLSATIVDLVRPSATKLTGVSKSQLMDMLQDSRRPREQVLAASGLMAAIAVNNIDREDAQQIFSVLREKSIDELASSQEWSLLLQGLFQSELLPRRQMFDMLEQMSEFECELSTQAWPGYLCVTVGLQPRMPSWKSLFRGLTRQLDPLQIKQVQIDGQLVGAEQYRDPFKSGRQGVFSHLDRSRGYALIDIRVLSKGSHVLQLNVGLLLSGSGNAGNVQDSWDRSSREQNIYVEQSFEMVGPLPEPVMVPLDEVLAKTLQEATTVAVKSDMHGFLIEVSFDPSQLPIGLSGEAVLRFPNERLIYLGRLQVLPSRHNDEDSRSTYKYHPWQTGFEAEDHMVEEPVTVEIIPWADHAMFRHAQSVGEPLQMLGDVAVLGVIEPDQLREGLPDHLREGLNHD